MAEQTVDVLDFVMLGLSNRTTPLGTTTYTKHAALHMPAILVPYHVKFSQLPMDVPPVPLPPVPPPPPSPVEPPKVPPLPQPPPTGVPPLPRPPGTPAPAPATPPKAPAAPPGASPVPNPYEPPMPSYATAPKATGGVTGGVGSTLGGGAPIQGRAPTIPREQGGAGISASPDAISDKVLAKDPNAVNRGWQNLQKQVPANAPPGYMDQMLNYWNGLETWQKVLLGAGLSIGAVGLLQTMFGGGEGGGGMMGPLLGIGGLAAGAYGAGLMGDPLGLGKIFGKPQAAQPNVNPHNPGIDPATGLPIAESRLYGAGQKVDAPVNYRAAILKAQQAGDTTGAVNLAAQMFKADPEGFKALDDAFKPGTFVNYSDDFIAKNSGGKLTPAEVAQLRANWPAIQQQVAAGAAGPKA